MYIDIKFTKADRSMIEDIYYTANSVVETYAPRDYYMKHDMMDAVYQRLKAKISDYTVVRYKGHDAAYFYMETGRDFAEIFDLYVFKDFRNLGLGTAIVRRCLTDTELPVIVKVFSDDIDAVRLFRRLGFVEADHDALITTMRHENN